MALAAIPFGLAIGLAVGMLGGGGSILAVPVLAYVLGESVAEATTASLVVVAAGALVGSLTHAREQRVCWRHAAVLTAAALPGLVGGTALADVVEADALIAAFALVMLAAAVVTWRKAALENGSSGAGEAACPPLRPAGELPAGVLIGFLTGFFGVGGGFLVVPALAIALSFSMRLAVGTSLAIITATSAIGLVVHLAAGRGLDPAVTAAMTLACMAGAAGGAALGGRIPTASLGRGFAVLLTAVACYLLVSVALLGGPPAS